MAYLARAQARRHTCPALHTCHTLQGKIRHVGLSNETPWGLMRSIAASDASAASACTGGAAAAPPQATPSPSLPRVASLQNAFSLTCRTFESGGLAEVCAEEGVSLLAYSPLAMGMLTAAQDSAPCAAAMLQQAEPGPDASGERDPHTSGAP
eukprot:359980-Chlamydomonas_euryale.AAC.1